MDNPNAFPSGNFSDVEPGMGMTLRDWFAGQAFGAAFSGMTNIDGFTDEEIAEEMRLLAKVVYAGADAMLAERAKGSGQ